MEAVLDLVDVSVESAEELNILAPFGKANEKPLYGIKNVTAENIRFVGKDKNIVSCVLDNGERRVRAVDFDNYEIWREALDKEGQTIESVNVDAVFALEVNEYNGYRNPQLVIKDIRVK